MPSPRSARPRRAPRIDGPPVRSPKGDQLAPSPPISTRGPVPRSAIVGGVAGREARRTDQRSPFATERAATSPEELAVDEILRTVAVQVPRGRREGQGIAARHPEAVGPRAKGRPFAGRRRAGRRESREYFPAPSPSRSSARGAFSPNPGRPVTGHPRWSARNEIDTVIESRGGLFTVMRIPSGIRVAPGVGKGSGSDLRRLSPT